MDGWRNVFEEVCDRIGQNRKYGLSNLRQVRKWYPGIPAVFYTRKSLISDAVAIFEAGVDGLFIKPTGFDDAETRISTRQNAPKLIEALTLVVDRHFNKLDPLEMAYESEFIGEKYNMTSLKKTWQAFRKQRETSLDPS